MPHARTPSLLAAAARIALVVVLCGCGLAHAADAGAGLADMEAKTDQSDPQQVFALAQWCDQNGLKTKALKYYNLVIRLDKDHEGARSALGQVKVGDHWVAAKLAGRQPAKADAGAGDAGQPGAGERQAKGPGPKASEIAWNLTPPPEPRKDDFIQKYVDQLPRVTNDSQEMANSIATFLMDDHLGSAISRLCTALIDPGYNDCYGAATLVIELNKRGSMAVAKPMLPFLIKASEHVTDAEDLSTLCFVVPLFHDKRALPRLIELMATAGDVGSAATDAVAALTLLPAKDLTVEKAQHWWDLNHNAPPQQIYAEQLNSHDPTIAVAAAAALYDYRDKAIVPVLIRLLKSNDRQVCGQAIDIVKKISGNDWGYDVTADADSHKKTADRLEAWWKDEQFKWVWMEDQKAAADAASSAANAPQLDPNRELVAKLASVEGADAQNAETSLRSAGEKAVPALIDGLGSATVIVRRKSNDLLKEIGKQDIPFDARGADADRAKAVAAWKAWAVKKGLMPAEDAAAADAGGAEEPAAGEDEQPDQPKKKAPAAPKPAAKPAPKPGPKAGPAKDKGNGAL